mmetsp:Transcript_71312/g.125497  ORF Transcript_71312/g.125497 Transcript_71312/m.125497 type:complete len:217 (+) Transcript_71312:1827-2477(+)
MHHQLYTRNVHPAGRNVRGDQHLRARWAAERLKGGGAILLDHVSMQGLAPTAVIRQQEGQLTGCFRRLLFGVGEDNGLLRAASDNQIGDDLQPRHVVAWEGVVLDGGGHVDPHCGLGRRVDHLCGLRLGRLLPRRLGLLPLLHKVHKDRRGGQHGPGHLLEGGGQGGAKHERLTPGPIGRAPCGRCLVQQEPHLLLEALLQHLIGLVQHEVLQVLQ